MKDKKFIFTRINGIDYISKDVHIELLKSERKQALKDVNKIIKNLKETHFDTDILEFIELLEKLLNKLENLNVR